MDLADYPFRRTLDVRAACAHALAAHLKALDLGLPSRDLRRFAHVFEEWADFEDKHEPPSACVMPGAGTYEDRALGPSPLEDTWRPEGQDGWVLWKVAEYVVSLEVYFRARDRAQRHAVLGALEDAFVPEDLGAPAETGSNAYGIILPVPDYYGRDARFTLRSSRLDDSADAAARNVREGLVVIEAHVEHVVVRAARAMRPRAVAVARAEGG